MISSASAYARAYPSRPLFRTHNIPIGAGERLDPLLELRVNLRLGRAAAHQQEGLLYEAANDAERVVQRALGLVEHLRERV